MKILIVESPLQVLNALEAIKFYKLSQDNFHFLLLNTGSGKNLIQMTKVLERFGANFEKEVIDLSCNTNFISRWAKANTHGRAYSEKSFEHVFLGDVRSVAAKIILAHIKPKKIIIIDDGNDTKLLIKWIQEGNTINDYRKISWKEKLILYLMGISIDLESPFEFFTMYPPETNKIQNLVFARNDYRFIKEVISHDNISTEEVLFIGNKFYQIGWTSESSYYQYLEKALYYLRKTYSKCKVLYAPHRGEKLDEVKAIFNKFEVQIIEPSLPIELYLITRKSLPFLVVGFFSSAFDTIGKILGDKIQREVFEYNVKKISPAKRPKLRFLYKQYRDSGLKIHKL